MRSAETLRNDALRIWRAAVEAVQPARLIPEFVTCDRTHLAIGDEALPLDSIGRIVVVGGGKAAGAMAAALEAALPDRLRVEGWVNVPADAMPPAHRITLHPARPPGMNEPTPEAAYGVRRMLGLVSGLNPDDVCVCLLSGGGSALLPAPVHGLSVEDKAVLARELSARGAPIGAINAVRRELSEIKGGGLARACRAGRLFSLVLSDVPGDSLADIASGPTAPSMPDPKRALRVLAEYDLDNTPVGRRAAAALDRRLRTPSDEPTSRVTNLIIGNNAAAVDAAGVQAERLGYSHAMTSARQPEGLADELGRRLAEIAAGMRRESGPDCLISGGEPTVRLAAPEVRGRGGRNQQLCLAALETLTDWRGLALVSGGTDGEDGPTDAAGAWIDEQVAADVLRLKLDVGEARRRNDAYPFFDAVGALLKTGATHTNVGDVRVVVANPRGS